MRIRVCVLAFFVLKCLLRDATPTANYGNCNFDDNSFCNWTNTQAGDQFDWTLNKERTLSSNTGPSHDHSGSGYYIYVESSYPQLYDQKTRLVSPPMAGSKTITFYYHLYGSTIETLSVYVTTGIGKEKRLWSRHGNQGDKWIYGCVNININRTYKVLVEAVTGASYTGDIAVDDIAFTDNKTLCINSGNETSDAVHSVNCTFDEDFCGWRNTLVKFLNDGLRWKKWPGLSSNNSIGNLQGRNNYIYVDSSKLVSNVLKAYLISPRVIGPQCLQFVYHMYGLVMGSLEIVLFVKGNPESTLVHMAWSAKGNQGKAWKDAFVSLSYRGEFQILITAEPKLGGASLIALDNVTLTSGLCDEEDSHVTSQADCYFESSTYHSKWCLWQNETGNEFHWTRLSGSTPSSFTGPSGDYPRGNGWYIYIETSRPRVPGDRAVVASPWMKGTHCMTFHYHMYGDTMSCVVIYVRDAERGVLRPVWVRSADRMKKWHMAQATVVGALESVEYQVVIEGIRGLSYRGDAAIDDIRFNSGRCRSTELSSYHVATYGTRFIVSSQYAHYNGWSEEFRFQVDGHANSSSADLHYLYSPSASGREMFSSRLKLDDPSVFPLGGFVPATRHGQKIYMFNLQLQRIVSVVNVSNAQCCQGKERKSYVHVTSLAKRDTSVGFQCFPGWYRIGSSCFFFVLTAVGYYSWNRARLYCHQFGSEFASPDDLQTLDHIINITRSMGHPEIDLYVGLQEKSEWMLVNGEPMVEHLWGPNQPSGDGKCGTLFKGNGWVQWKWNDISCTTSLGVICEDSMIFPNPVALYPLDGRNTTQEISPDSLPRGIGSGIELAPGPFGRHNGSFYLRGLSTSFIEFQNNGGLDTRTSITVLAWIYMSDHKGPIFNYGTADLGIHISLIFPGKLSAQFVFRNQMKSPLITTDDILPLLEWRYVGASYDFNTGMATLFMDNMTVASLSIGDKKELDTRGSVRIGAIFGSNDYYKGRISCLQIYDVALTDEQINNARNICMRQDPIRCRPGFVPIRGKCFFIQQRSKITGTQVKQHCVSLKTHLAIINKEYTRKALSDLLERDHTPSRQFYIGLVSKQNWKWKDGTPVNSSLWSRGYPIRYFGVRTCAIVSPHTSRLMNVLCSGSNGFVCQGRDLSFTHGRTASFSSMAPGSEANYAADGMYTTCFATLKEHNSHWTLKLDTEVFVYNIHVTKNIDCCREPLSTVTVTATDSRGYTSQCGGALNYGVYRSYVFSCEPPVRAKYLIISSKSTGQNSSLVLCEVFMYSFASSNDANGVLREAWYQTSYNGKLSRTMRTNSVFKKSPSAKHVIRTLDSPTEMHENYVQRLTTYLQVPYSGNYTFYIACDDQCELWRFEVKEEGIGYEPTGDTVSRERPLAKADFSTGYQQWDKHPSQKSAPVFLHRCFLYKIEAYMREAAGFDHLSVGMRLPHSGLYERPIRGERLYSTLTGKRVLNVTFGYNNWITAEVGSAILITGSYIYCCNGVYCPDCPLDISLNIQDKKFVLNHNATMSCNNSDFMIKFEGNMQPGNYSAQLQYSFVNESVMNNKQKVGTLELRFKETSFSFASRLAVQLERCNFVNGVCNWNKKDGINNNWKVASGKVLLAGQAFYSYIDGPYKAWIESNPLPWQPFHRTIGVCLRFLYHMSNTSNANLTVYKETNNDKVLIWNITGYHGDKWNEGRVSWKGEPDTKIRFEGAGSMTGSINIAIADVMIVTETCTIRPSFSKPGFRCKLTEFQCDNGQCVKANLRCDGDKACLDGSDEKHCSCPTNKFLCPSGECIPSMALCNDKKDCKDGSDETSCRGAFLFQNLYSKFSEKCQRWINVCTRDLKSTEQRDVLGLAIKHVECTNEFQCVDGSCTPWSSTCKKYQHCPDLSNDPAICDYTKCSLNDLGCAKQRNSTKLKKTKKQCKSMLTRCRFENGLCGLTLDRHSTFQWSIGSGSTPTKNTGPSFDRSRLTEDGSYIFIEASQRKAGDHARLVSGWLDANESACLQFWYHMYGKDIGQLRILVKTNQSEAVVWMQAGDHGDKWMFAQVTIKSEEIFKFVLEGVTADGKEGDTAVDDLVTIGGTCKKIVKQRSIDCNFEGDMCGWTGHKDWVIAYSVQRSEWYATLLPVLGSSFKNMSSPSINTNSYQWRCVRFWYSISSDVQIPWHSPYLYIILQRSSTNQSTLAFFTLPTPDWWFAQLPLPDGYRNVKVVIYGYHPYEHGTAQLKIDNISFSKEPCQKIPWAGTGTTPGNGSCSFSLGWCGWKSSNNGTGWAVSKYTTVDLYNKHIESYMRKNNLTYLQESRISSDFSVGFLHNKHAEIHLSDIPPLYGFSWCLWLKTSYSGFYIEYQTHSEMQRPVQIALNILDWVMVTIKTTTGEVRRDVLDDEWHFICLTWSMLTKNAFVYIDGLLAKTIYVGYIRRIPGDGIIKIGHRVMELNASSIIGTITNLNIWSFPLNNVEIKRMSLGCGEEHGDVRAWFAVRGNIRGRVSITRRTGCNDNKGDRLVLQSGFNSTRNGVMLESLFSPRYNRSAAFPDLCLKFRYMMFGPGVKRLTLYHQLGNGDRQPIWVNKYTGSSRWRYGQTPIAGIENHQVTFVGILDGRPGYIALGIAYLKSGTCIHMPVNAKKACNERFIASSGYVTSPQYPGYYTRDIHCTWRITAPKYRVIRLEFLDFMLEEHVTCRKDYVEIRDGDQVSSPLLGRFCGYIYPQLFESSTNYMTIVFHSDSQFVRRGFKAYYYFVKGVIDESSTCSRPQGCPSGCKCSDIAGRANWGRNSRILVNGEHLLATPGNLPLQTAVLMFQRNRISQLREENYQDLPYLTHIDLSNNIITNVDVHTFKNISSLDTLRLNSNFIRKLPPFIFNELNHLQVLDLGRNLISDLEHGTFQGLAGLTVLSLRKNSIKTLRLGTFNSTTNLTHLYLQDNLISNLPDGVFNTLADLQLLHLGKNKLTRLTKKTFQGLDSLRYLYLENNMLSDVSPGTFSKLRNLKYLKLDRFIICCYAKKAIDGLKCESPADQFSSCDDLMKNRYLQVCVWILGLMALLGNIFVIVWRMFDKEGNQIHSLLLTNLAIADLLMGIYLLIIGIMDAKWQGMYFKHDIQWRSGIGCQIAGILSMLSSEVSVLILTIITADRLVCIVFPFKFKRMKRKEAIAVCAFVWIFGLVISVLPVSGINYFHDKRGDFGFYGRSAVCLALQLSEDRPAGWEYSVIIFIGVNSVAFMFMLGAYISMFWTVKRVSSRVRSTSINKESAMAKKLIFIIMTDFFCWMPVIVIGIMSLTGVFYDPTKQVYVWIAVFVLPVNSSINPILYTFSTAHVRKKISKRGRGLNYLFSRAASINGLKGRKIAVPWLRVPRNTAEEGSRMSILTPSLPPRKPTDDKPPARPAPEPLSYKIRLIETPDILQDEMSHYVGFVVAMVESRDTLGMYLIKYFSKEEDTAWKKEVDMVLGLYTGDKQRHQNLLNYCWHSTARVHVIETGKEKIPNFKGSNLLICYDFVSSTTLEDFLKESAATLDFDTLCVLAIDVISAIEYLERHGIRHNNINTTTVLIGPCLRITPVKAVLAGFSKATANNDTKGACSNATCEDSIEQCDDIEQFGQLLAVLLGHCHGSSEYTEIHEIMNICFDEAPRKRPQARQIRELLENAWCTVGVWDTFL